jgi:hypothetical protein
MKEKNLMGSVEKKTVYFKEAGMENTDIVLATVKKYVEVEKVEDIVVASTTGSTGAKAAKIFQGCNVTVVAHSHGFKEPGKSELDERFRKEIMKAGAKVFVGTHALSSVERAVRKDFGTIQTMELMANVLRRMGEGTKVCVEITLMTADAGLIPVDKDIVAIGGTGRGADTALRICPANTARFFDLKIREIIAKPSNF